MKPRRLSAENRAMPHSAAVAAAAVAAALLCRRIVLTTGSPFLEQLANLVRILLYLGLFAAWGVSVHRRTVQLQVRRLLSATAFLMVLWLTVREYRWHLVLSEAVKRWLWYAYYIPILMIPLLALLVSLSLGRPENYRLPKRTALLFFPTAILIFLVLTNDLHRLVFRFPALTPWTEANYSYAPGYYLLTAWGVLCGAAAFAVMLSKCRLPRSGRFLWLPLIPFGVAVLYIVLYAMRVPFVHDTLGDLTVSECLLFAAFFESCIQCGLIQSNTRYAELFRASVNTSAQIADNDYAVRYAASGAEPISKEDMLRAEAAPIILRSGKRLHNMPIRGGHTIWTEDISELLRLREKLEGIQEELNDRSKFVRMEYAREKERVTVEEQNRLYDLLQSQTQAQFDRATELASSYEKAETWEEKHIILAKIVVLGSYIKRRRDLTLSMENAPTMPRDRLGSALGESFRSLALLNIRGGYYLEAGPGDLPADLLTRAYDFFEDVTEAVLDAAHHINVQICTVNGALRCSVVTDAAEDPPLLLQKYPQMRLIPDEDGGAEYVLPLTGGERL